MACSLQADVVTALSGEQRLLPVRASVGEDKINLIANCLNERCDDRCRAGPGAGCLSVFLVTCCAGTGCLSFVRQSAVAASVRRAWRPLGGEVSGLFLVSSVLDEAFPALLKSMK